MRDGDFAFTVVNSERAHHSLLFHSVELRQCPWIFPTAVIYARWANEPGPLRFLWLVDYGKYNWKYYLFIYLFGKKRFTNMKHYWCYVWLRFKKLWVHILEIIVNRNLNSRPVYNIGYEDLNYLARMKHRLLNFLEIFGVTPLILYNLINYIVEEKNIFIS